MEEYLELEQELHKIFESNKDLSNIEKMLSNIKKIYGEKVFQEAINAVPEGYVNLEENFYLHGLTKLPNTNFLNKYLLNADYFNTSYSQNNTTNTLFFLIENGLDLLSRNQTKYMLDTRNENKKIFASSRLYNSFELIVDYIFPRRQPQAKDILINAIKKIDTLDQETIQFIFTSKINEANFSDVKKETIYKLLFSKMPSLTTDTLYNIVEEHKISYLKEQKILEQLIDKTENLDKKTMASIFINYCELSDYAIAKYHKELLEKKVPNSLQKKRMKV